MSDNIDYTENGLVSPVFKWVGGKRQLLPAIKPLLPGKITSYCEPFVGGGAVLFALQPQEAVINDINSGLIFTYAVIKDNVEELIGLLETYPNDEKFFYELRNIDRVPEKYVALSDIEKAARMIFLNKTCFNGLYRVNSRGEYNSPFGRYKNPNIVNAEVLRAVSEYFNRAAITFSSTDFSDVLERVHKNTFVYLDPPYDPVSDTASFTGYSKNGFDREQQIRLRECCDRLDERGVRFMLSNSATDFIREQYSRYHITIVQARRAINSVGSKRGNVDEVIVTNY